MRPACARASAEGERFHTTGCAANGGEQKASMEALAGGWLPLTRARGMTKPRGMVRLLLLFGPTAGPAASTWSNECLLPGEASHCTVRVQLRARGHRTIVLVQYECVVIVDRFVAACWCVGLLSFFDSTIAGHGRRPLQRNSCNALYS